MSTDEKFAAVLSVISEHNSVVGGAGKSGYVDPDSLVSKIKAMGGTSDDRLKRMSYEEIAMCLPSVDGVQPVVLAKEIASIFRGSDAQDKPTGTAVGSKKADRMSPSDLVNAFDPEEPSNAVGKRLGSMSRGEKFVVFIEGGRMVDAATTLKLLLEVKAGYPGRDRIQVGQGIRPVYRIGELPDAYADENPLYPGRPLRPDGACDQTGRSWAGIPAEVRQLVYTAVSTGELKVSIDTAHSTIDMALKPDALATLRARYQAAAVKLMELYKVGNPPRLLIPMGSGKGGSLKDGKKVIFE